MPYGYVDDWSGGICERTPQTLDATELQDCRNVMARGGVLRHAPVWKQLTATLPEGKQLVEGVTRQDGSTVLVFWSAADQYEYGILNEAGDSISDLAPLWRSFVTDIPFTLNQDFTPLTTLTEAAPVHGVYTPDGTVLACEADGYWPFVVFNHNEGNPVPAGHRLRFGEYVPVRYTPNTARLLEEQDIRYRQAEDYRVGVQEEERLFSPAVEGNESNNWDPIEDGSIEVNHDQYLIVSTALAYNFIDIRFASRNRNLTGAYIWVVDINGEAGLRADSSQRIPAALNNVNNFIRMQVRMEWDARLAQPSLLNYKQRRAATIGTGQYRAVIQFQFADGTSDEDKTVRVGSLDVRHNQYLRLVCDNKSPHLVTLHRNRVVFAFEDTLQFSPYNRIRRWEPDQEYFREGGTKIQALQSHRNFLAVFLDNAIHAVTGNSYQSRGREKLIDYSGTDNPASTASDLGYLAYEDVSNNINMMLSESNVRQVLHHIEERVEAARGSGQAAFHVLQNDSMILVYHNGNGIDNTCFVVDPETVREDRGGGWKCAAFPFDGPGIIKASWSSLTRIPYAATDTHIYQCIVKPTETELGMRQVKYLVPLHAGGSPSGYQVKRLTIDVTQNCQSSMRIEFKREGPHGTFISFAPQVYRDFTADEIARVQGSLTTTVPYLTGMVSAEITCNGPRLLKSMMFEYVPSSPGGMSL